MCTERASYCRGRSLCYGDSRCARICTCSRCCKALSVELHRSPPSTSVPVLSLRNSILAACCKHKDVSGLVLPSCYSHNCSRLALAGTGMYIFYGMHCTIALHGQHVCASEAFALVLIALSHKLPSLTGLGRLKASHRPCPCVAETPSGVDVSCLV